MTSTEALVESTTNELIYNQIETESQPIAEIETTEQCSQSTGDQIVETVDPITTNVNGDSVYIEDVIAEKMDDIDNNNEKTIEQDDQEGLFSKFFHIFCFCIFLCNVDNIDCHCILIILVNN